ncbi:MAG: hypothetical protein HKN21_05375 [Candidatus Eisenbacteria bacterium]|uniref:DUF6311 domain-containing protein n=1 Tax=Eiseniibacteriota bacterium TaxID=2212470 RepID=A0A7Y2H1P3_UNCEI|nr:hypothetical protein [Candidatus Eisenbacteria bacterium]
MIASRNELILIVLFFLGLALIASWPLPMHMDDMIPVSGTSLDGMHLLYALTWSAQVLGDDPLNLFGATLFYPHTTPVAFFDHMVSLAAIVAPVNWASGNMYWGYNVAWLLTFLLSGLGAYLLTRYLTDSKTAALLAGILFAFFPFRYHNAGQINVLAMMWIPFALLTLHLWVETRLKRQLFMFAAICIIQFLSSAYSGVFLLVAAVVYMVVLWFTDRISVKEILANQSWIIVVVILLSVGVLIPFVAPYINANQEDGFSRSLGEAALYSAQARDFVTPNPDSPLGKIVPWAESARHPLFPGVVGLGLFIFWIANRSWRRHPKRPELLFYLTLAIFSAVLAMGPALGDPESRIPLPFAGLFYAFPGFSFIRAPVRFAIMMSLAISVLAGMGLSIIGRGTKTRSLLGSALIFVAAFELMLPIQITMFDPLPKGFPQVYHWLGSVEGDLAILELPMPADESLEEEHHARYQLYSLLHRKRIANGVAAHVPTLTQKVRTEMQEFPSGSSVARLRELGINYVLLHTEHYDAIELARMRGLIGNMDGIHLLEENQGIWVLDVVPRDRLQERSSSLGS